MCLPQSRQQRLLPNRDRSIGRFLQVLSIVGILIRDTKKLRFRCWSNFISLLFEESSAANASCISGITARFSVFKINIVQQSSRRFRQLTWGWHVSPTHTARLKSDAKPLMFLHLGQLAGCCYLEPDQAHKIVRSGYQFLEKHQSKRSVNLCCSPRRNNISSIGNWRWYRIPSHHQDSRVLAVGSWHRASGKAATTFKTLHRYSQNGLAAGTWKFFADLETCYGGAAGSRPSRQPYFPLGRGGVSSAIAWYLRISLAFCHRA